MAGLRLTSAWALGSLQLRKTQLVSRMHHLAENLKIIILANQPVIYPEVKDIGTIFLADRRGGTAYVVQSDKAYTEPAGRICVIDKIRDVHVNFDKQIPVQLLENIDVLNAKSQCDALVANGTVGEGNCLMLINTMTKGLDAGYRVLLWGVQANGVKLIVNANVSENGEPAGDDVPGAGLVTLSTIAGATVAERPLYQTRINNEAFQELIQ